MDLGLKGRKAIVTGGTRGIGRAIVEQLAREGCDVAICARNPEQLSETVEALKGMGVKATGASVDIADKQALDNWIADAAGELGGLDILIANASALAGDDTEDSWRAAFEIDMMGTKNAIDAALPFLEKSDAAAIVAISSISALMATGGVRAYASIKAALINHMSNIAHTLASKGIRANTVSPGTIYFEGGVWHERELEQPEVYKYALERNPTGRMGTPQEVANATVFLASPAASFITGTNLIVDGAMAPGVQY